MTKNLVIVESPTKCGTVRKILGSQYEVKASFGHIAQLTKSGESDTGIRIENGKVICDYEPTDRGKATLAELKRAVKEATMVYLATDEDREGEGISSNLTNAPGSEERPVPPGYLWRNHSCCYQ